MADGKTPQRVIQDVFAHAVVGSHTSLAVTTGGTSITIPSDSRAWLAQAINQNVRYKLTGTAGTVSGFQMATGQPPISIPLASSTTLTVAAEAGTATLEYQFLGV